VPKPIRLPFDPITRAAQLWTQRWGRTSQPLAMASATSIMRVQQLLITEFDAMVGRHGLTFARYEALVLLAFSREGRLSMSKIGQRLMVHPTSATNIVQRLAAQGFVERVPNPLDGRGTLAVITPAGRDAMEAATRELVEARFGLGMLSASEHEQLFELLRKVRVGAHDFDA
jgi:DNA-binding MarR family transcriptional regulator